MAMRRGVGKFWHAFIEQSRAAGSAQNCLYDRFLNMTRKWPLLDVSSLDLWKFTSVGVSSTPGLGFEYDEAKDGADRKQVKRQASVW